MGSDSLAELLTWHRPDRLIRLCCIVALTRPGHGMDLEELNRLLPGAIARVQVLEMPLLEVSSSDLQRRVRLGLSIKYLVPPGVEQYIYRHGLYRQKQKGERQNGIPLG
jgi:nicotinate-nucleotide adenylyltransferase